MIDWHAGEALARPTAQPARRVPRGEVPGETGMWVLVGGDLVAFGVFFLVFVTARGRDVAGFDAARQELNLGVGLVNTLILLVGSLLVVAGVSAARRGLCSVAAHYFGLTIFCGATFVAGKVFEYTQLVTSGHTPRAHDFYMYFFMLTGIHLFHLLIATLLVMFMWRPARRVVVPTRSLRTIVSFAVFWHMVDLLWLVLFSLFYLMR